MAGGLTASATLLDFVDLCPGCAHLVTRDAKEPQPGTRITCDVCGVPVRQRDPAAGGLAGTFDERDPYLSALGVHICHGCEYIVQDERAWQLRKSGAIDNGYLRCRCCHLPVPARRTLPTEPWDSLVERVRAGQAGAATALGARHRRVTAIVGDAVHSRPWQTTRFKPAP